MKNGYGVFFQYDNGRTICVAATDDHNKRIELYKQAQVVMHDQAPALIIAHSTVYEPVRKEVKGYVVDPLGKHHFDNVSVE